MKNTVIMTEELATYSERGYDYVLNNTDRLKARASSYEVRRPETNMSRFATQKMVDEKKLEMDGYMQELTKLTDEYKNDSYDMVNSSEIAIIMSRISDIERRICDCKKFISQAIIVEHTEELDAVCPLSEVGITSSDKNLTVKIGVPDGVSLDSVFGKAILGKCIGDEFVVKAPAGTFRYTITSINPIKS